MAGCVAMLSRAICRDAPKNLTSATIKSLLTFLDVAPLNRAVHCSKPPDCWPSLSSGDALGESPQVRR
jgi:hypothetical protein